MASEDDKEHMWSSGISVLKGKEPPCSEQSAPYLTQNFLQCRCITKNNHVRVAAVVDFWHQNISGGSFEIGTKFIDDNLNTRNFRNKAWKMFISRQARHACFEHKCIATALTTVSVLPSKAMLSLWRTVIDFQPRRCITAITAWKNVSSVFPLAQHWSDKEHIICSKYVTDTDKKTSGLWSSASFCAVDACVLAFTADVWHSIEAMGSIHGDSCASIVKSCLIVVWHLSQSLWELVCT